jgi:hypothetical protein
MLDLGDVHLSASEEKIFKERTRLFLVDHERGKHIRALFGLETFALGKSGVDGEFSSEIVLSDNLIHNCLVGDGGSACIGFQAALPAADQRAFRGEAFLLEETGLSVISDVDDTIKITQVSDRKKMMRNTFAKEFEPAPGMAKLYQRLAREQGAQFHYMSASPWQLYEPLAVFMTQRGFPPGTFSLKEFRWKNNHAFSLFVDPEKYKPTVIEPLLKQFPKRRFILIGDSGERDPEIYAALARKFPGQIERIYIRNVTGEPADAARYQKVFTGLPPGLWQVFTRPEELALPEPRSQ